MWYWSGTHYQNESIGYATSLDGISWTKYSNNPVLEVGPSGAWDDHFIHGCTVLLVDSIFHMWYTGHIGQSIEINYRIGHATSPDGINWTKDQNNPVLDRGQSGDWDEYGVLATGSVIHDGLNYRMWYEGKGNDPSGWIKIGHAISPDGINWTKDTLNPVISPDDSWEGSFAPIPKVVYDGSNYKMWYSGGNDFDWKIGYATSEDGRIWEKYDLNPVLSKGPAGSWEQAFLLGGPVLDSAGVKYKMWYAGEYGNETASTGYAESDGPAWKQMESMEIAKGGAVSCVLDSMIYVFGGANSSVFTENSAAVYNTETNEWSNLENIPLKLYLPIAESIKDKIFVAGGWINDNGSWYTSNKTFEYDPRANSWTEKANSPFPSGENASCVLNDKIIALGGNRDFLPDTSGQTRVFVYDPELDTWDSLPDMLYERVAATASILDSKIYVLGGFHQSNKGGIIGKTEMYDPGINRWTELKEMPIPVVNHISVVYDNKILVFGGDTGTISVNKSYGICNIQEYDPSTDTWRIMQSMPFNRANMTGQRIGNYVYLIGGYSYSRDLYNPFAEVWRINLDLLEEWVVPCNDVLISQETLTLETGESHLLSASVLPAYAADRSIVWHSINGDVATVSEEGLVTAISTGSTFIRATAKGGDCFAACVVSVTSVGVRDIHTVKVDLFPNPSTDHINLNMGQTDIYSVEIFSNTGRIICQRDFEGYSHQIDLTSFQKGVYFITIRSKEFVTTRKIIKL
jgi:N-acetylneuraminic acid mutarotase/predicted GH43/DUF377 family glycosyl hydrolase